MIAHPDFIVLGPGGWYRDYRGIWFPPYRLPPPPPPGVFVPFVRA
jgi:hypothetical protein